MTVETPRGRSPLWARVFAAVVLGFMATLIGVHVVAEWRTQARERAAFDGTRADARAFVGRLLARGDGLPSDGRIRDALPVVDGGAPLNGRIHAVTSTGTTTRVTAVFSRHYERASGLFGGWGGTHEAVRRCFTLDFPAHATRPDQVRITAHDSGTSCAEVVADGDAGRTG